MSEYKMGHEVVSRRVIKSVDEDYKYPLDLWEERIYQQGRADAIDSLVEKFFEEDSKYLLDHNYYEVLRMVAEKLKEQKNES